MKVYFKLDLENYIIGYQTTTPKKLEDYALIDVPYGTNIILNKHKIINGELVEDEYSQTYLTKQENIKLNKLRAKRELLLKALDVFKTNVNFGIETITSTRKIEIIDWYNSLLDLNEDAINNVPSEISYYIE